MRLGFIYGVGLSHIPPLVSFSILFQFTVSYNMMYDSLYYVLVAYKVAWLVS